MKKLLTAWLLVGVLAVCAGTVIARYAMADVGVNIGPVTVEPADKAPAVETTVYLYAVFIDGDRVLDGQRYNKKTWETKAACDEFLKSGGGTDPAEREVFATSLIQLRPLVQHFAEEHSTGKVVFECATEANKKVKGEQTI
jgi:hypothetical protein